MCFDRAETSRSPQNGPTKQKGRKFRHISTTIDGVVVDGSRPGEDVQTIFSLPMPRSAAGEAGLFETTFLDDALRIARAGDALRVFERVVDT